MSSFAVTIERISNVWEHTQSFRQRYRPRARIEGTISHEVFALGMRRSWFSGQAKTHLQFLFTAYALNHDTGHELV